MEDGGRLFREYATRISFNLSLSRGQAYALWVMSEQSNSSRQGAAEFGCGTDNFVVGARWLCSHGLVSWTDPAEMKPKWKNYPYMLTEAGKHTLALLRIAGIVPTAAANDDAGASVKRKSLRRK